MMGRHHLLVAAGAGTVVAAVAVHSGAVSAGQAGVLVAAGSGMGLACDFDEPGSSAPRTFGWLGRGLAVVVAWLALGHRGATHTLEALVGGCVLLWWAQGRWPLVAPVFVGCAVAVAADGLRGVSSPKALVVGAAVGWWVSVVGVDAGWLAVAAGAGWLAHLVGDAPTPYGIPVTVVGVLLGWPCLRLRFSYPVVALRRKVRRARRSWWPWVVVWRRRFLFSTGQPLEAWVAAGLFVGCVVLAWRICAPDINGLLRNATGGLRMGG